MDTKKLQLMPFEPTIEWWRHCLEACGCGELARQFADDACWDEILKAHKKHQVPEVVIEAAVAAIARCKPEHSFIAFTLMRIIGPREELIDKIIVSENAQAAYAFCRQFGDHAKLRAVVRDKGDETAAFYYCRDVANDPDMARVVLKGHNAKLKARFTREVR
jgi:hypothetical protein